VRPVDLDRPPRPRRSPFLILFAVVALVLCAVVAFEIARDSAASAAFGRIVDVYRVDRARGKVVDAATGRGIPGASIRITTVGWSGNPFSAFDPGDQSETFEHRADDEGWFDVPFRHRERTHLDVHVPGYAAIARVPWIDDTAILPTSRFDDRHPWVDVVESRPEFGVSAAVEVALDSTATSPDVRFERAPGDTGFVVVRAPGGGGLFRIVPAYREPVDPVALRCIAPAGGYVAVDSVSCDAEAATWFVQRRDGRGYARIQVRPRTLRLANIPPEERSFGLTVWRNEDGGRQLCPPPPSLVRPRGPRPPRNPPSSSDPGAEADSAGSDLD
jgi:hypothetical protein